MLTATSSQSLYGRIVQRYFAFGLACICVLLALTLYATAQSSSSGSWILPFGCVVPLGILWLGGFQLRKVMVAPEQILSQLSQLSREPSVSDRDLIPVTDAEPAAAGWNQLLQYLYAGGASKGLEDRLAAAIQHGSGDRMANVVNSLSDGVAVTDASGRILSANPAFYALMNTSPDAVADDAAVQDVLRSNAHSESIPAELTSKEVSRARFELSRTAEISQGVLRITCAPILTDDDETDSFVWTVRDVTQVKLAEEMRTQFVETATHELRTPLTNIRAYAETLELTDDIPVEQQKEFVNVINAEATRLGRFVDELLNLSQMDAGGITIHRHSTDFERMLFEAIENAQPQMDAKRQSFHKQVPAKLSMLNIDKDKITACLVNLLGNASKYTPDGGDIHLVVEESDSHIAVRVEDTGFGIDEQELPNVFNRFFRSDDDRVREESGSGLGLAYTQEIVRLHGGRLTVESKLNEGSQFTMTLPL